MTRLDMKQNISRDNIFLGDDGYLLSFQFSTMRWTVLNPILAVKAITSLPVWKFVF